MANNLDESTNVEALQSVIRALLNLDLDSKQRIIQSVSMFFGLNSSPLISQPNISIQGRQNEEISSSGSDFSKDRSISPKQFLLEKRPLSLVERIACLAYYLTHYRDTPHFKNVEVSALNTEAAQPKLIKIGRAHV